ncbi:MAG: SRPBCC domain-containing protein [Candidatus Riflebacteria bacterium]|nr:SRPBCC domain-containing protein [Candidatus Riflebacteria bacterium]
MQPGKCDMESKGSCCISRTIKINAQPRRVWDVLTREDEIPGWCCDSASFDIRVNGKVEWRWSVPHRGIKVNPATVVDLVPHQKLTLKVGQQGHWTDSIIRFDLKPDGNGTELSLTHEGLAPDTPFDKGDGLWRQRLESLRYYAECGRVNPYAATVEPAVLGDRIAEQTGRMLFVSMDFIGQRYGETALDEYRTTLARSVADGFRAANVQNPLHLANLLAQNMRLLYGDEVEVSGNVHMAVLERSSNRMYEVAHRSKLVGDYESFCKTCADFHTRVAKELGYGSEARITTNGYRLTFTR